jgi:hypothetical protein
MPRLVTTVFCKFSSGQNPPQPGDARSPMTIKKYLLVGQKPPLVAGGGSRFPYCSRYGQQFIQFTQLPVLKHPSNERDIFSFYKS